MPLYIYIYIYIKVLSLMVITGTPCPSCCSGKTVRSNVA